MVDAWLSFAVGLAALSLDLIAVPVIVRATKWTPVVVHILASVGAEVLIVLTGLFVEKFLFWPATSVLGFGAIAHLFAFSAVYKSVSLRMLMFLAARPDRTADIDALTEALGRPVILGRMSLLCRMGLAEAVPDGKFQVTPAGRQKVRQLASIQRLFGIREGALYGRSGG
jgi:hypothetical protein